MAKEPNYEKIKQSDLPHQLANEHWEFMKVWLELMFKDGFIHGYKHGMEESKDFPGNYK